MKRTPRDRISPDFRSRYYDLSYAQEGQYVRSAIPRGTLQKILGGAAVSVKLLEHLGRTLDQAEDIRKTRLFEEEILQKNSYGAKVRR